MQYILGLSYNYHDSSAVLIADDEVVAACEEERFSRIKHDKNFPANSIRSVLDIGSISLSQVSLIVIYEDSYLKLMRQIRSSFISLFALRVNNLCNLFKRIYSYDYTPDDVLSRLISSALVDPDSSHLFRNKIVFSRHHLSHAASAFYPSGFNDAAVLCIDGVGEDETLTAWHASGQSLSQLWSIKYPHSVGLLYSTFTSYCGFKVNSGEYKLMGLAPYGSPIYADVIKRHLVSFSPHHFRLNMKYFSFQHGADRMYSQKLIELLGSDARQPETTISQFFKDVAASIQLVCEEIVLTLAASLKQQTGLSSLVMAGGVALNCVANGRLRSANIFDNIWIQPASGDSGSALGAAYLGRYVHLGHSRPHQTGSDSMKGSLLGPSFSESSIKSFLDDNNINYEYFHSSELFPLVANFLSSGNVVGWFSGRMEFGPRALGSRSILGDPRDPHMQKTMNLKIKFRESFRPFAPAVLENYSSSIFDGCSESRYMLFTHRVLSLDCTQTFSPFHSLPSITHVDQSARVQTVSEVNSPQFFRLISSFFEKTGCPVLINTSFNLRGEPIVCTPNDAFDCFMRSHIDILVLEGFVIKKSRQSTDLTSLYSPGSVVID